MLKWAQATRDHRWRHIEHQLFECQCIPGLDSSVALTLIRDYLSRVCSGSDHAEAVSLETFPSSGYKRVKRRSHTVEKQKASQPQKPHATSQPSRFSHTPTLSTDAAHNKHSYQERPIHTSHHDISTGTAKPACPDVLPLREPRSSAHMHGISTHLDRACTRTCMRQGRKRTNKQQTGLAGTVFIGSLERPR